MDQAYIQPFKTPSKDEILFIALKLFAQKGFFNTSLTDIKEAADIKTSNGIYLHYKDKQAIALAVYEYIMDTLNVSIDDIRRKNRKPSEQLRETVNLFFKLAEDAPDVIRFLFVLNFNEFLPSEKPLLETPAFIKIKKIFIIAAKEKEIRNIDANLAYTYFFGIINTLLSMSVTGGLQKSISSYQAQAWTIAWNTISQK